MGSPEISIIVPIYKTEKYLRECLSSVQNQTFSNFEVILVNDCTPDNAMLIAMEFAEKDPRFRIINHEINQGLSGARNSGINLAKGKYLNFLDSDDKMPLDALQILHNMAQKDNADMVIGNMAWLYNHHLDPVEYINDRIQSWKTLRVSNIRQLPDQHLYTGNVANRLFKSELIKNNNIQFIPGIYFEDMPFSVESWFFSNIIDFTTKIVNFHTKRDDPNNLSITQTFNQKAFYDRDILAKHIFEFAFNNRKAVGLCRTTLFRVLNTSSEMVDFIDNDIKRKIKNEWFPLHTIRLNKLINELNKLDITN